MTRFSVSLDNISFTEQSRQLTSSGDGAFGKEMEDFCEIRDWFEYG